MADLIGASKAISYRRGAAAVAPVLLGVAPFGVVTGIAARESGLGVLEAFGLSFFVFAGASQLATIELLVDGAPIWVIILTAAAINLRLSMYSASLRPHLANVPRRRRLVGSYLLTDHTFAASVARFDSHGSPCAAVDVWWFYLGTSTALWLTWQCANVIGALVAASIPPALPLGFAIPLTFLGLLVPSVTDKPRVAAAVTGAVVAVLASGLPANLGMPVGALAGIVVGTMVADSRGMATQASGS
jgi:predicted branched-subunit amino acid permease